jgi:hypothetical protein
VRATKDQLRYFIHITSLRAVLDTLAQTLRAAISNIRSKRGFDFLLVVPTFIRKNERSLSWVHL